MPKQRGIHHVEPNNHFYHMPEDPKRGVCETHKGYAGKQPDRAIRGR